MKSVHFALLNVKNVQLKLIIVLNALKTELELIAIAQMELMLLLEVKCVKNVIINVFIVLNHQAIVLNVQELELMLQPVVAQLDIMKLKINLVKFVDSSA